MKIILTDSNGEHIIEASRIEETYFNNKEYLYINLFKNVSFKKIKKQFKEITSPVKAFTDDGKNIELSCEYNELESINKEITDGNVIIRITLKQNLSQLNGEDNIEMSEE